MIRIKLTRDSVCMGDDCDAPHFLTIELPSTSNIKNLIDIVGAKSYLPMVAGFNHSWLLLVNNEKIVTLRGNNIEVRKNSAVNLSLLSVDGTLNAHFKYLSSRT